MRRSLTRIRTSHVGRLPPPKGWADMPARLAGAEITDPVVIAAKVTPAIAETVKKQIEAGIDCIGDGEFWTARNLAHYAAHFTGVEARPVAPDEPPTTRHSTRERDEFPSDELPELKRQSREFGAAWSARGLPWEMIEVAGCHHYAVLEQLARPDGLLMKALAHSRGPIRADDDAARSEG